MKIELTAKDIEYLQSALEDALFCFKNLRNHKISQKDSPCYTCKQYRKLRAKFKKLVNVKCQK